MTDKVDYEELLPHEFEERLNQRPVGYLPLGTLEWHGPHAALGSDAIQSRALFRRAARKFGGIVLPPLWFGPDRIKPSESGPDLIGMDYAASTQPNRQLTGSLYWVPQGFFLQMVEACLSQAKRAGFRCIVADGHGPSRQAIAKMADSWEQQYELKLISAKRDFPDVWRCQIDHAGLNETSIMMAVAPELVDQSKLPEDRNEKPLGVGGKDPRDATAAQGEEILGETLGLLGAKLDELRI